MQLDLKIVGGTIVDGSGRPGFTGDVGIRDGKIVALGRVEGEARTTIDAKDRVVAPGFIDAHTHYDAQVFWDRMMSVSSWHGVTSVVMGNCGFAIAPTKPADRERIVESLETVEGMNAESLREGLGRGAWSFESFPEYLEAIERIGSAVNIGVMAGHMPTRFYVMGDQAIERTATDDEIRRMGDTIREALEAGALGFATSYSDAQVGCGGKPVASRYATFDETRNLARIVREFDDAIFSPNVGAGLSLDDVGKIAEETQSHVSWTPLLSNLIIYPVDYRVDLEKTGAMRKRGLEVYAQTQPKPIFVEFQFTSSLHFESTAGYMPAAAADRAGKKKLFADSEFRRVMREAVPARSDLFAAAVAKTEIGEGNDPATIGKTLGDVAAERGLSPVEAGFDLAIASDLNGRFRIPVANHVEKDVETLLSSEYTHIGLGDGGAHIDQLCDANTPTFFLRRWVREKKTFTLEEAVRMLTSRLAHIYHLHGRGRLGVGLPADVVVFDPKTVGETKLRRVQDLPANGSRLVSDALGIDAVIVNGVPIRRNGIDAVDVNGRLPGTVLRRGHMSAN